MGNSAKLYWGFQIIGWFAYSSLIFFATYNDNPDEIDARFLFQLGSLTVICILSTHIMRQLLLKLKWLELKFAALIPRLLIISFVCSTVIELVLVLVSVLSKDPDPIRIGRIFVNVLAISVLVLFWNAIYVTYHYFQKSKNQELNNLSLEASKNEIELKNLRSQLNPHFLFNSLNSIRALVDTEPAKAKNAVTTLSNLLRKSLIMGKENLVSIESELLMVSNYLELEKIRFEERLSVTWDIDDRLNSFLIPPFCLQMLVENAIKHGISNIVDGGEVIIRTSRSNGNVEISVSNSGQLGKNSDTGIGIANTRRRLDIQYNGKAEFVLAQRENSVVATLIFNDEDI